MKAYLAASSSCPSETQRLARQVAPGQHPATAHRARVELELQRTTTAKTRLLTAYQDALLSLEELRERMPALREREDALRTQLDALAAQALDHRTYLTLAETLDGFLARLRDTAEKTSVAAGPAENGAPP